MKIIAQDCGGKPSKAVFVNILVKEKCRPQWTSKGEHQTDNTAFFFLKIEILFSTFTLLGLYSDKIRIRPAAVLICNDYTNGTTEDKVDKYDLWSNIRGSRLNQIPRERII